ncbi:hypothetical protein QFW77_00970 [Luteimonas sp. RD2P54]|uniref:Uncharacterized protein n=1 Tax=Luteimonas endophytica TaxID=3042023 RepID=A0ABT6J423_9GAMM|nr:hypothetical protein [Luteimonas endophytica]MDH5821567.1 hypothetical protein [Luteimonas endophytica]
MLRTFLALTTLLLAAVVAAPVVAQDEPQDRAPPPPPPENVRIDYARVLSAEPVYQTLRATSMVERCEPEAAESPVPDRERRGLSRVVGAVRDVLTPSDEVEEVARSAGGDCRMVPVEREFRRPIGYDVDYVHKGVKYRSRLPYDPGNRVRVRISVTPVVSASGE